MTCGSAWRKVSSPASLLRSGSGGTASQSATALQPRPPSRRRPSSRRKSVRLQGRQRRLSLSPYHGGCSVDGGAGGHPRLPPAGSILGTARSTPSVTGSARLGPRRGGTRHGTAAALVAGARRGVLLVLPGADPCWMVWVRPHPDQKQNSVIIIKFPPYLHPPNPLLCTHNPTTIAQ